MPSTLILRVALTASMGALVAASAADATTLRLSSGSERARKCHARLASGLGVARSSLTAPATGLVRARLTGARGDWDLAVFDSRTGRRVASSASTGTRELAEGFVARGQRLVVQGCRLPGAPASARLTTEFVALAGSTAGAGVLRVRVHTRTVAQRNRLNALGLDLLEGHDHAGHVDVVAWGKRDLETLRRAGFRWTVEVDDLAAEERARERRDGAFARRTAVSALPSGRDSYRVLADYESEMKTLATRHPGLVKLIELPHKSLEGRPILGVEISQDVNASDGKPVYMQLGVHHAREWPAGEHPMEWAYELVTKYGSDARTTDLVNRVRTIVIPIVNPDGFNMSREGGFSLADPFEAIDPNPLPQGATAYGLLCCSDTIEEAAAYKRKNCRLADGQAPAAGACAEAARSAGVDPNRNYGAYWGGPGASWAAENDTYRGAGPFSEPETQNIRDLISRRHVTTLITNHTFSGLVLRAPGIRSLGEPVDEAAMKALGDAMAAQNGYVSQPGYALYDTTGTTEDWSYAATGGYGYTFEIGFSSFHPDFERGVVDEYEGAGAHAGKGNRAAYYLAMENAANPAQHSVLKGTAPKGRVLRLHKEFDTFTSNVLDTSGFPRKRTSFHDVLDSTLAIGKTGRFEWHVNPSTRPSVAKVQRISDVGEPASKTIPVPYQGPSLPTQTQTQEFTIAPSDPRRLTQVKLDGGEGDDFDIYLYRNEVAAENVVGSSAGPTADENLLAPDLDPGKYVLEIVNYAAVQPYSGEIKLYPPAGELTVQPKRESYTLTCETASGKVVAKRKVFVGRGAAVSLGNACKAVKPKAKTKRKTKSKRKR